MPTYDYPGVYIEERPAANPIQGVGTSTAAFIGICGDGPANQPTFITSFDEFKDRFGKTPQQGAFLWYAVRSFFENGGRRAYIVRVGAGKPNVLSLVDSRKKDDAQPVLLIEEREPGVSGDTITVDVSHTSLVSGAEVFRFQAPIRAAADDRIQVDSADQLTPAETASRFRPGDHVLLSARGKEDVTAEIQEIRGDLLILRKKLEASYGSGNVRLVDLDAGTATLRLTAQAAGLARGSVIALAQETDDETVAETALVDQIQSERIGADFVTYRVQLAQGLTHAYSRTPAAKSITVTSQEFSLKVSSGPQSEEYGPLSLVRGHPNYAPAFIAAQQQQLQDERQRLKENDPLHNCRPLVVVREPEMPSLAKAEQRIPAATTGQKLDGGAAGASLTLDDFTQALNALRKVDDINFVAIPDSNDLGVQNALLSHCFELRDRVALFHAPSPATPPADPGGVLGLIDPLRDENGFGAFYYPWLRVPHPDGGLVSVPPTGHVAGVYARADRERGVHKAPANYMLKGALGVTVDMNDEMQGPLNIGGVNVLRMFPGQGGPTIWGARTTATQTAWQYVNIRRLFLFLEESIQEGIRWAVFEPNNLQLWQKLKRTISEFLTRAWRDGALFGATAAEAFYVRIDETLNPDSERALGRLYIEIGVRPSYPAEFIIVRIGLWQGGSTVNEG